jgi:hypothetical protein
VPGVGVDEPPPDDVGELLPQFTKKTEAKPKQQTIKAT